MAGAEYISLSAKAGADLSGSQYLTVRLDETSGTAKLSNATSVSAGVLQNKPVTNQAAAIVTCGVTYAQCTGTIAIQTDRLAPNDSGVLTPTTSDNDEYMAHSLEAHTEDGATCILKVFVVGFGGGRY
jgi:hypothetical protein